MQVSQKSSVLTVLQLQSCHRDYRGDYWDELHGIALMDNFVSCAGCYSTWNNHAWRLGVGDVLDALPPPQDPSEMFR